MMNHPDHIQIDDEILAKYLSGEASPEEAMAVDQWAGASRENRAVLDQAMKVWNSTSNHPAWQLPGKPTLLSAIRMQQNKQRRPAVIMKWTAAAAMLLLAALATFYLIPRNNPVKQVADWVVRDAGNNVLRDTLPDQSVAVIGSHSSIRYAPGFSGKNRQVYLSGNASFDVTSASTKPFLVNTGEVVVKVLGTSFDVSQQDSAIAINVRTGAVQVSGPDSVITLRAGESTIYLQADRRFMNPRQPAQSTGQRSFNFNNATLREVASALEKAYQVKVVFENKKLETCTMSSAFENKPLTFILDVVSITLNVRYRIDKNIVYISGNGCN
ncbi:FecR domain-containing protein [Chitinophaga sp. 212800010-3]|uniref:FecR family protein n=1 Tax=unclassified Chitinophaga TaxID=2619133 RepID=UPI002DE75F0D|nr:DUF4974 domain-containing protein [Chitinophaga sp. 212800010-3]